MHKRRGWGEEEYHNDSECKLVVEVGGWKVKGAGSRGGGMEEAKMYAEVGWSASARTS